MNAITRLMPSISFAGASPPQTSPFIAPVMQFPEQGDQVHFSGGGKERLNAANKALLQKLEDAGVTKEKLQKDWGVTLWSLRQNGKVVRAKVEVGKGFNVKKFSDFLLATLADKQNGIEQVNIYLKPVKSCCKKPCEGCLRGNKSTRKTWTA